MGGFPYLSMFLKFVEKILKGENISKKPIDQQDAITILVL
jgi:hypothetical protein